jgi:hypothetical protein
MSIIILITMNYIYVLTLPFNAYDYAFIVFYAFLVSSILDIDIFY